MKKTTKEKLNKSFREFFKELSNVIDNEEMTKIEFLELTNDINNSINELEIQLLEVEE